MNGAEISVVYNLLARFDTRINNERIYEKIDDNFILAMKNKESLASAASQINNEVNALRKQGTIWTRVKSIAFISQVTLIFLNVAGYLDILIGIKKRLNQNL